MRAIVVVLLSLVLVGFCFSVNVDDCVEITTPGTYDLTTDISGAPFSANPVTGTACIKIAAPDVVLDCNGHSISHDLSLGSHAIVINDSAEDAIVQNCVIHDYDVATYAYDANGHTQFLDNVFYDNNRALLFTDTEDSTVAGNEIMNITDFLHFVNTGDNVVEDNTFHNASGFFLTFTLTGDNIVDDNEFLKNTSGGFLYFTDTGDNTVQGNEFMDNTDGAFLMFDDTGDNIFSNNDFLNETTGVFLMFDTTGDNTVEGNRFRDDTYGSFFIFDTTGDNTVEGNRFLDDTFGSFIIFDTTGDNVFSDNTIHRCGGAAIIFDSTGNNLAEDNKILYNTSCAPFTFSETGNNVVRGNELDNIEGGAFWFVGTGDNVVKENYGYGNPDGGEAYNPLGEIFIFGDTGDNTVDDNEVHHVIDGTAFLFESTGHNSLDSNSAYNLRLSDAFMFMGTRHNTLDNNLAAGMGPLYPASDAFYFEGTWTNTLTDNSAYNVSEAAFMFFETWSNTLEDNTAAGHDPVYSLEDAFFFDSTLANTLTGNSAYNMSSIAFFLSVTGDNTLENNFAAGGDAMYPMETAFLLDSTGHNILTGNEARNVLGMAFLFEGTNDNVLNNNLAAGAAPVELLGGAFFFQGTDDNTLTDNYAYNVSGTAFLFDGTGDNTLTNTYALTDDPWSLETAFLFIGTDDNALTNSHAYDVSGDAFVFDSVGNNVLTDSIAYGKSEPEEQQSALENISGYGGERGNTAFLFLEVLNNTLTNSEAHSFENAFIFDLTNHNTLANTYAEDIGGDVLYFAENYGNNSLENTTVIDPRIGFVFESVHGNVILADSYLYNASEAGFSFTEIDGDVSLSNTEYDGVVDYASLANVLIFGDISGDVDLADTFSSLTISAFMFGDISGDVTLDNSHNRISQSEAFIFEEIEGEVSLTDSIYEGVPSAFPKVFYFGAIGDDITVTDAYASYVSDVFMFEGTDDVELTNAEVYVSIEEAFIFNTGQLAKGAAALGGHVTVTDSTSGRCDVGMYIDNSDVTVNNHHFYDSSDVDFHAQSEEGSDIEINNAVFDRRSADGNVQTTLSISDELDGEYYIRYSYQPDDLPANHGSFAGKFLEMYNVSPTSIDEITWSWAQSEVNSGGYTESEFELWAHDGSWSMVNGSPDTVNNEFTQYGFVPSTVYAILEDNAPATQCREITSSGSYQMSGDYLGAVTYMDELVGDACVLIDASDVTFDCRGHRIIGLYENDISAGVGITPGQSDVVVKNCVISGYSDGIYGDELVDAEFTGNDISDAFYGGIKVNNITGELVVSDNIIHNSRLISDAFGGVYLDNDFEYDFETTPTASLSVEGNTIRHLYCHEDAQSCGIGGFFADDLFSDVTISDNLLHHFEAPDIELASAAFGYRSRVTDNTAHHIYSLNFDGSAYSAGFVALGASVTEDAPGGGEPELTLTGNEIYEYYVAGNDSVHCLPMGAVALSVGDGFDGVQTTVADNSIHDVLAIAINDEATLFGTIVVGVSAEMIEAPVEITGNEFYNAYAISVTDDATLNANLILHLNPDELDMLVAENEVHHLYSTGGEDEWETTITAFQILPIFYSSAGLNFSNNSLHHMYSNGMVTGLELRPYTAERLNYWEEESSVKGLPHEFGATAEEKEFMTAIMDTSSSSGYGYADDIEFMATIEDNSVHDFTSGYGVIGLLTTAMDEESGATMRVNRSAEVEASFTGNTIYNLFSTLDDSNDGGTVSALVLFGLWPNVTVGGWQEVPSANGGSGAAATGDVTTTIAGNNIHHLSGADDVFGIGAAGIVCTAFGYGDDECAVTNTIEDNTVHHLKSFDSGAAGIAEAGIVCVSKDCTATSTKENNAINHVTGDYVAGLASIATVCVGLDYPGELEAPVDCSAASATNDNTIHSIYSIDTSSSTVYGIYGIATSICVAFSEDEAQCTADAQMAGNTIHHVAANGTALGATNTVMVCMATDGDPSSDECTSELSMTENNVHDVYSLDMDAVGIAAGGSMLTGDSEINVEDNEVSQIHGEEALAILMAASGTLGTGSEEGAEAVSGQAAADEIVKFHTSIDINLLDNRIHSLSGLVPVGIVTRGITCLSDGADCSMQYTMADNTVQGGFGEMASMGFIVTGMECMGYGYASDTCGIESTIADNEGSNLVADEFAGGLLTAGINCYGYGPSCDYETTIAENTLHELSASAGSIGLGVSGMTCVEGEQESAQADEEDAQCTAPLIKDNLVYDTSAEESSGIFVFGMDKAELRRNTVHHVYGEMDGGEPEADNACMGLESLSSATLSGNLLHSCTVGLAIDNSSVNATPAGGYNHIYDTMGVDLYIVREGGETIINISKLVFDSNSDSFSRYTMLSGLDMQETSYVMDHATRPKSLPWEYKPLPEGFISFEGKFIDIAETQERYKSMPDSDSGAGDYVNLDGAEGLMALPDFLSGAAVFIPDLSGLMPEWPEAVEAKEQPVVQPLSTEYGREGLTWHWFESETDGYNEANLQLWVCLEEEIPQGAQGAVIDCEWTLLNDTPDTEGNMLSFWDYHSGSVFAILHNGSKGPTGDDDEPGDASMDAGFSSDCEDGNVVTVTKTGGDPLYGATVKVFDADTLAVVASGSTDSNGEFDFSGCGFTVSISVKKGGYVSESLIRSLVTCEECEEGCLVDSDCPEGYICVDGECVPEPECVDDKDCPKGYECKNGECIPEELECTEDAHCPDDHYCDEDGECKPVTGQCGYAEDHEWVTYACGREEGCPDCPEGLVCENRKCVATGLDCPESVFVGTEETCRAAMNGDVCADCDYTVTDPTGTSYTGRTDENGNIVLPFDLEGLYRVALVKDGEVISEVQVEVVPKAPPTEEEKPTEEVVEDITWLWLLVLLALLAVAFLYWRRRKGEKVAKKKKK